MGRMVLRIRHVAAWGMLVTTILCSCGRGKTPVPADSSGDAPVSEAEARRIYTMKCSLCHGSDGRLMASQSPDLSTSEMNLAERKAIIKNGKGAMPPQVGILTTSEIEAVAKYIETFRVPR